MLTDIRPLPTYLEMNCFDPCGIEKYLYMGTKVRTHFARVIKKSTWFAIPIKKYLPCTGELPEICFDLSQHPKSTLHFLLHLWLRFRLPQITLLNTAGTINATSEAGNPIYAITATGTDAVTLLPITVQAFISPTPTELATFGGDVIAFANAFATTIFPGVFAGVPTIIFDPNLSPDGAAIRITQARQQVGLAPNFLINAIESIQLIINDQLTEELDPIYLQDYIQFRLKNEKAEAFERFINAGDQVGAEEFVEAAVGINTATFLPERDLKLILPFSFERDPSVAFPFLKLCNVKVLVCIRFIADFTRLLIFRREVVAPILIPDFTLGLDALPGTPLGGPTFGTPLPAPVFITLGRPAAIASPCSAITPIVDPAEFIEPFAVEKPILFAKYGTVTEDEKRRHIAVRNCRHLLAERVLSYTKRDVIPGATVDIPLGSAEGHTKAVYFHAVNKTAQDLGIFSNFTNNALDPAAGLGAIDRVTVSYKGGYAKKFDNFPADHFHDLEPYWHDKSVPEDEGFYAWYYALKNWELDPNGSVDFKCLCPLLTLHTRPSALAPLPGSTSTTANTCFYWIEVRVLQWVVYKFCDGCLIYVHGCH